MEDLACNKNVNWKEFKNKFYMFGFWILVALGIGISLGIQYSKIELKSRLNDSIKLGGIVNPTTGQPHKFCQ